MPGAYFRFDFLIDADPALARKALENSDRVSSHALQRRLDALLPPRFSTIWINDDMDEITDAGALRILKEPYSKKTTPGAGDWNIEGARWRRVDELYPIANWEALVTKVTARARELASTAPSLKETTHSAKRELATVAARILAQLSARLDRLEGAPRDIERTQVDQERALFDAMDLALERPRVRLDSVGAIFLSK